jgi:hypothetical protein
MYIYNAGYVMGITTTTTITTTTGRKMSKRRTEIKMGTTDRE